ncbi:MAG: MOSC N-terminal beta barrel domain-containing protein, partial [Pseudomonadales bacterium]
MSQIHLHSIHQHPVKSCAPIELSRGWIDELGLSGDRRYMVADENGLFMTARKYPKLTQLMATPFNGGLI